MKKISDYTTIISRKAAKKRKVTVSNVTKSGRITKRPTEDTITICKEYRNIRYVMLYKEGSVGKYNVKSLVLDRPINQLGTKTLSRKIKEVSYSLNRSGEVVMKAVLA